MNAPTIVALDGPSGAGKSTVARLLAERLGLPFLETGAMYRAVGLKTLEEAVDPEDRERVEELARRIDLRLEEDGAGGVRVLLDGRPLGDEARTPEVSARTSRVSVYGGVRRRMVERQRSYARRRGAVVEGRDIGSKVFPETPFKFYLDAPVEVRAERRLRQLREAGGGELAAAEVLAEVAERDRRDAGRADSPLTLDASYELVDTGPLTVVEVVDLLVERIVEIRARLSRLGGC